MILRFQIKQESVILKKFLSQLNIPRKYRTHVGDHATQYLVNNQSVANHYLLKKGDILEIVIPCDIESKNVIPIKGPLSIVYEDSYLLILSKEANLVTTPTRKHFKDTLANRVLAYYKEKGILAAIHFVSRLDASTSGLIVLAKSSYVMAEMKRTKIEKKYLLITEGKVCPLEGKIETNIIRESKIKILRKPSNEGKKAITLYRVLKTFDNNTLVEATLLTGRTHQIRVHFQSIGYPIVGDRLYGKSDSNRLLLHSYHLSFIHPITKQDINLTIYPDWYQSHYSHS